MIQTQLKRIAELRETEIPKAKQEQDWKTLGTLQVELTALLDGLKPIFRAMGQHVKSMNRRH